jgi:hypothetical protein
VLLAPEGANTTNLSASVALLELKVLATQHALMIPGAHQLRLQPNHVCHAVFFKFLL